MPASEISRCSQIQDGNCFRVAAWQQQVLKIGLAFIGNSNPAKKNPAIMGSIIS
jgi:hypothetical protein